MYASTPLRIKSALLKKKKNTFANPFVLRSCVFIANLCLCTRLQKYNSYKLNRYVLKDRPMICQISARFSRKSLRNAVLTLAIIKVFRKSLISKQFVVIQNIKLFDYCWPDFSCSPFFFLLAEVGRRNQQVHWSLDDYWLWRGKEFGNLASSVIA